MSQKTVRFLRVQDLPKLELYRTTDAASFVPRHVHSVFSLSVAEAGVRIHETKQGKHYVTPGSVVIVNLGESHCSSVPDGCTSSTQSIRLDPVMLTRLVRQVTGYELDNVSLKQPVIYDQDLAQQILHVCNMLSGSASTLEKECSLLNIFAKLYDRHSLKEIKPALIGNEYTPISRVREYLQDCFAENVSLDKLAEIAGFSPFHLARIFAKQTGVPPHTYQLQIRLTKATELLASGKPIADVALATGFCDQSHFQKAFKKKFGITPGRYEW